jgi:subtilisin family serine protease
MFLFRSLSMSKPKILLTVIAAAAAAALLATPLLAQAQDGQRTRVVVSYKAGSAADVRAAVAKLGGKVEVDLDEVDAVAVTLPRAALAALRAARNVVAVDADPVRKVMGTRMTPKALGAAGKFTTATSSQVVPYGISMVQADQLPGTGSWTPKVCIVDSGIDGVHEDLSGNILDGKNYTTSGSWNTDENEHGTHVAGTIAALDNSIGVIGVAGKKEVSLYIAKVFDASGSAPSSTIAKAMLGCAKAKANVVSMSLGGSSASPIEAKVVKLLDKRGMLLIAAAGNAGDGTTSYPAGFAEVVSVAAIDSNKVVATFSQFNADVEIAGPGVNTYSTVPMGVGVEATATVGGVGYQAFPMTGSVEVVATSTLYDFGLGTAVDAGAAGKVCLIQRGSIAFSDKALNCQNSGGIGAIIYNNVSGPLFGTLNNVPVAIPVVGVSDVDGASMLAQVGQSATVDTLNVTHTNYTYLSGTSMATPHVSSVAARVWSYFPSCTAAQIRTSLNNSAQDLGAPGRDINYGYGLVQAKAAYDRITALGCGF